MHGDSLQRFVQSQEQQQQQLMLQHSRDDRLQSSDEEEEYEAYSSTFLTGMNVADLQQTPLFQPETNRAAKPISTSSVQPAPRAQIESKQRAAHAAAALRGLLARSHVPTIAAAKPSKRVEASRAEHLPSLAASSSFPPSSMHPRPFSSTRRVEVRQPRVARVYARMEAVLQSIEDSSASRDEVSRAARGSTGRLGLSEREFQPTSGVNVRKVRASHYAHPEHARTMDRVRARRRREQEEGDVAALMRTVAQVSKVALQ